MPKIEFFHNSPSGSDYPPRPAKNFIPKEYKNLESHKDNDLRNSTVKKCVPFLDALTGGYIIPFFQDYLITMDFEKKNFDVRSVYGEAPAHGSHQLPNNYQDGAKPIGKFENKWVIKTPPGYSCLFMHPINTPKKDFEIISGIVDTDSWVDTVLFPYYIRRHDESETKKMIQIQIKIGDPMVQIIPFKRESWTSSSMKKEEQAKNKIVKYITRHIIKGGKQDNAMSWGGRLFDAYKKMYWHKKDYK